MKNLKIICGSPLSARTSRIDEVWYENRNRAILLLPAASLVRRRLQHWIREYRLPGVWGTRAWGISEFARFLVIREGEPAPMLSTLERRLLVLQVLETLPEPVSGLPPPRPEMFSGLARHLLQVITALKQAAIEPVEFRRCLECDASHPCDTLVAHVYERYQGALKQRGCYDVPGMYWEAENALRQGRARLPEGVDTVLLDGFDDFTPSQTRFLEALSEKMEGMCIGLNYDAQDDRPDLYGLQQEWVERIRRRSEPVLETCPAPPLQTVAQHVAAHLFWRNPPPSPAALPVDISVTPCIDLQHEVEHIGRHVKTLLCDGKTTPGSVAVVFADVEKAAGTVRAVFREMGIPCRLQSQPSLAQSAVGAWLMLFFEVMNRWDCDPVVALLTSPLFDPLPVSPRALAALPALARQAGIVTGHASWIPALDRLEQAAARLRREERELAPGIAPETLPHLVCLRERLVRLQELASLLPESAPVNRFAAAVDTLLTQARIEAGIRRLPSPEDTRAETNALGTLRAVLESVAEPADLEKAISRALFVQRLRECLQETRYMMDKSPPDAVVCGGLSLVRGQAFEYVFAAGLNEGILPAPESVNTLYDESDVQRLRRAGIPVDGQRERGFRERVLFLQVLTAAQRELALSYRLQDADGRDTLPSPFVVDVLKLADSCANVASPPPLADAFVAAPLEAASPHDLASAVFYHGHPQLEEAFSGLTALPRRLAKIEAQRHDASPFGVYDGVLQDFDVKQTIARKFGDDHAFSVNQMERYLQCPFHFFMDRVLRVRETRRPEGEIDPLTRGVILHEVLERFHMRYPGMNTRQILEKGEGIALAAMQECIQEAFARHAWRLYEVPEMLCTLEQNRAGMRMQRYLKAEAEKCAEWIPAFLEWSFGRVPGDTPAANGTPPFELRLGEEVVRIAGKIDRVDRQKDGWRILDYKFGSAPETGAIRSGLSLQLTVYAWAAANLLEGGGKPCLEAYYVPVGKKEYRPAIPKKEDEKKTQEATVRRQIHETVHAIRNAQFPPVIHPQWKGRVSMAARYEPWRIELKMPETAGAEPAEDSAGEEAE